MNKGPLGTSSLNQLIKNIVNPGTGDGFEVFDQVISYGDKVIQVKNNYDKSVFNGDIGKVISLDQKQLKVTVDFDGRSVDYDQSALASNLSLAYAITIHKSQGSEYPVVIMLVSKEHHFMLARNLVYTGLTRGRELVFVIGQRDTLVKAARKVSNTRRWTLLPQALAIQRE